MVGWLVGGGGSGTQASETMAGQVRRVELPVKKVIDPKEASIWGILKKNIGKNLSKISMY